MSVLQISLLKKLFYPSQGLFFKKNEAPFVAVNDISFEINAAETVGLLGPNGAGKTTTLHMLLGTLSPTAGTISYFGKNFEHYRSAILQKVGFASTYVQLPGRLTVYENLSFYGRLYGLSHRQRVERIAYYLKHFGIWDLRDRPHGVLSAGEKTRVMLVKAFLHDPMIVLLDEPTAALDPDIAQEVRAFVMCQQREQGVAFLFTSHNMAEVTEVCDRVLVMQKGNIVANNTPEQLALTVGQTRVTLLIIAGMDVLVKYLLEHSVLYGIDEHKRVTVELNEHNLASFLQDIILCGVKYAEISIAKPCLEDYFLHIAKQQRIKE